MVFLCFVSGPWVGLCFKISWLFCLNSLFYIICESDSFLHQIWFGKTGKCSHWQYFLLCYCRSLSAWLAQYSNTMSWPQGRGGSLMHSQLSSLGWGSLLPCNFMEHWHMIVNFSTVEVFNIICLSCV